MTSATPRRIAAVAYPLGFVTGILCLWRFPGDRFIQFHAWQSILFTTVLLVSLAALEFVPLLGIVLTFFLVVGGVGVLGLAALQAFRRRWFRIPLVGDLALECTLRSDRAE